MICVSWVVHLFLYGESSSSYVKIHRKRLRTSETQSSNGQLFGVKKIQVSSRRIMLENGPFKLARHTRSRPDN
jgi:hypothetical protein